MALPMRRRMQKLKCSFCTDKVEPTYVDYRRLRHSLTEKGKIVARSRSGVCMKHQKALALAVKRARHLGLLPFVSVVA